MKLIICDLASRRRYTSREAAYIVNELINDYGWNHIETGYLYHTAGSFESLLLQRFGRLPEVILFWEGYYLLNSRKPQIEALGCDKYILCDDLHESQDQPRTVKLQAFSLCNTILSTCGYIFYEFFPELTKTHNVVWVPHAASADFLLPYNQEAENAIFLSGALSHHYPLRLRMKALADSGSYPIVFQPHPGYYSNFDYETGSSVGPGFARRMNLFRVAFTDSSKHHYALAKYFEIPATGALLLADRAISEPLKSVGFIEGLNYVGVADGDLEEQIAYVLDERNRDELDQIRKRGQHLVWQKHKTSDRARQIDDICLRKIGLNGP